MLLIILHLIYRSWFCRCIKNHIRFAMDSLHNNDNLNHVQQILANRTNPYCKQYYS